MTSQCGTVIGQLGSSFSPNIAEHSGSVSLENIEEGVTVANQIDEITGVSTK